MAAISGCKDEGRIPELVEVECPECGEVIELFVRSGVTPQDARVTKGDCACEKCGFKVEDGTPLSNFKRA